MAPHTRLVRRAPLLTRLKAYLNPLDALLWLSEELQSTELQDVAEEWAIPIGIILNVTFMIARANSYDNDGESGSEVFGDAHERSGSGWLVWIATFEVYFLSLLSIANAVKTFWRRRHYRLFEASVDATPNTSSAHRVRVDSSPLTSSPLRFLSNIFAAASAEARAHPDATRDVWEVLVWDPVPTCLWLFCLFSPGHILIYWLFLPLRPLDPRPSVTVATMIVLVTLLSVQMTMLKASFSQQAKDTAIIHKEVQNEYDVKFVRPIIHKPVRDVGTQSRSQGTPKSSQEVLTYTPTTFVNRGFQPHPNPNYAAHYDPDGLASRSTPQTGLVRATSTPDLNSSPLVAATASSGRLPQHRHSSGPAGPMTSAQSHAQSPLKRAAMFNNAMQSSPLKRASLPAWGSSPVSQGTPGSSHSGVPRFKPAAKRS